MATVVEFIDEFIAFNQDFESSLKELYLAYKKTSQSCIPLGKLIFKKTFLYYAKDTNHPITVFSTTKGVIFEGASFNQGFPKNFD